MSPPKRTAPVNTIFETIKPLKELSPDFISVTYGAGGKENNGDTFHIASEIKNNYGIESVVHLPCIGLTKSDIKEKLDEPRNHGIENILALRGDLSDGVHSFGDFKYASDLVAFIKDYGDFNIIAACYPEGHIDSNNYIEDIHNLKTKVDAGADHLITQLFFDNNFFYKFIERCQFAGIKVPIEAGIMPIINKKQIDRMVSLCGTTVPHKFAAMMERYENDPIAVRDAGIAYAINQIVDLIAQGVDGIHLYTMNNPYIAVKIHEAIRNLIS